MIILVTNRKISINHKLVVSKLILWVQMLQRASIRSLLVKSKFKGRVFSRTNLGTIKYYSNFFQISTEKGRYSSSCTTSPVEKRSRSNPNYYRSSLKHVYHYTCQCTKTSRRIQICSTRGTNIKIMNLIKTVFLGCEKRRKIRLRSINPLQTK